MCRRVRVLAFVIDVLVHGHFSRVLAAAAFVRLHSAMRCQLSAAHFFGSSCMRQLTWHNFHSRQTTAV